MTHAIPKRVRPNDDTGTETSAENRDPHGVERYALLAENMPSVLGRLRPMDISSNGMLRYLMTKHS